ncbi:MAG TPA: type II secretion system secretin GspD, partial [Polyangiaceae bacterium]|nr:type II secretion system secretin GspD [Polyangiaceae bacterium]
PAPAGAGARARAIATPQPEGPKGGADAEKGAADAGIDSRPKGPGELVTLSLENADLPELVRAMSEMTGRRFVIAAAPKSFQANVIAPQKVTVAEAYQAFLSILAANRLTVVPQGRFSKIVDAADAAHEAPVEGPHEPTPAEDRFVTCVHRVAHVSADQVATGVLSKLASHDGSVLAFGSALIVTDTGTNVRRMMRVLEDIDVAQAEDKVWLEPLAYAQASDAKKELDELIDGKPAAGGEKAGAASGGPTAPSGDARVTKVVALERPNALLIVGTEPGYRRMLELIRSIDVAQPSEGQMHVVMLEHAEAKKIVGAINDAVNAASAPAGAPGGPQGKAGVGALDATVKVSAEETNNALIVTATAHDYAAVREVIRRLDRPRRQVYIEAVVMDLSVDRTEQVDPAMHGFGDLSSALGAGSVAYGGFNPLRSLLSPTDPNALQGMVLGVRGPSIPVPGFLQQALGQSSIPGIGFLVDASVVSQDSDILQTPNIMATDNQPAEIHVQLNTSLQKNAPSYGAPTTGGTTGASGTQAAAASAFALYSAPATANYGKIGPKIKVTPHIDESDEVRLDVEETISDLTNTPPQGTLGTVDYTERGATTTLTVKNGHTAVIGGLVRDKVEHSMVKVPLLGDLPVLGALFRSTKDTVEKGNLVLVLTPHIIREEDDMREIFEKRMQERQEFVDRYFAFRDGP